MIILFTSHLVKIVVDIGNTLLESLSLSDGQNQVLGFLVLKRQSLDELPMVEHTLREGFSLGKSSKVAGETE
jgi:hypothetical protein